MTVKHLSPRELAERWGVKPRTLERWRTMGHGPQFLRLGGRVAYRQADIEAYEASHYYSSVGQPTTMPSKKDD